MVAVNRQTMLLRKQRTAQIQRLLVSQELLIAMSEGTHHEFTNPLKGTSNFSQVYCFCIIFLSGELCGVLLLQYCCIVHSIVHYVIIMSFVLMYVIYCASVISVVPHVFVCVNLLSTIKLYPSKSAKSRHVPAQQHVEVVKVGDLDTLTSEQLL